MIFLFFAVLIMILTGCSGEPLVDHESVSIRNVVSSFLDAEQVSNFNRMENHLTGEALAEAAINSQRKQVQKEYLSVRIKEKTFTSELALVYADITVRFDSPSFVDRYALNFYLIQQNRWLIYKVEPVAIERPAMADGEVPASAKKLLEEYLSMPYELKKYNELDYLAGRGVDAASQMGLMQDLPAKTGKGFKVQEIKSLGCAEGYCIAKVIYSGGNNDTAINAVVDLIDVAGRWKITRLDIIGQERGN